jgi:hypothetical protein
MIYTQTYEIPFNNQYTFKKRNEREVKQVLSGAPWRGQDKKRK